MTVFIPVSYLCRNMVVSYLVSYPVNANWFHTWFHTRFHTWFHTSPSPQIRQARSQAGDLHKTSATFSAKRATYRRHLRHFAILVRALRGACVAKPVRARSAASVLFGCSSNRGCEERLQAASALIHYGRFSLQESVLFWMRPSRILRAQLCARNVCAQYG